jgi:DNA-binding Lrp family transcriptional regulator
MKELSKQINVSWPTVKKRYSEVVERGLIRKINAIINYEDIGLQLVSVYALITSFSALLKVEQACTEHPYTRYRSRAFGEKFGILIQFEIPRNKTATNNLEEFLRKLENKALVSDVWTFYSTGKRIEIYPDIAKFDLDKNSWNFSWKEWFQSLKNAKERLQLKRSRIINFEEFNELRLNMLKELTINGGLRQSDLMEKFNLSRTEAHRQYQFVKENFIKSFKLDYDNHCFDLTETYIIIVTAISEIETVKLFNHLKDNPPPFRFAVDIQENNEMFIWGTMSPVQANDFVYLMWEKYVSVRVYRINVGDEGAFRYCFYPANFDFTKKQWKTSREYMIKDPLKRIE